ncbi:sugar phosphate isomerase/epimerase family protein [Paenibacillus sp. GCM10023252]|uniref:sugar phosphate isomerase/epimerase family protein n=1 Tax=Paenibacillus sp. GCM10023252 TaxID=3252649 RepID=UPI003621ECA2
MEINIHQALWGLEGSYRDQLAMAAAKGYAGIEAPLPPEHQAEEFRGLLKELSLTYIAQVVTSGNHEESFAEQAHRAAEFEPILIVSHSAKDSMHWDKQLQFFESALRVEKAIGIQVGHETHRSRAMFTPWATAALLRALPDLRITADLSHWCCVTESLLEDNEEDLKLALERAIHIHGRVGYAEGPQVPHPGAPEYAVELNRFQTWWQEIIRLRKSEGKEFMTITPEFGPAASGYMHTQPYTGQPVVDMIKVNDWMAERIRTFEV